MDRRYTITIYAYDDDTYDIGHEADDVLLANARDLQQGDPEAKKEWKPYQEFWLQLMDIPAGGYEEDDEEDNFGVLS